jgi:hypothetical protein
MCRRKNPWRGAAAHWMVHSSLADLGCLAVLRWLLRKEGKTLESIVEFDPKRARQYLKSGLVDVVALAVGAGVSSAIQRPFYPTGLPPQVSIVQVPR